MSFWKHGLSSVIVPVVLALPVALSAQQVVPAPATPQIGSSNPVSPEPNVPRPSTTPCAVTLYTNMAFNDYSAHPISFTPPAGCPGPWARVVLTADFTVTAGRQYDRTGTLFLGNTNIFFGTTAEPRANLSPSWHVERDLTDYSALFTQPQTGAAFLGNIYNSTYNGAIYGNATLLFYPANAQNPAPAVPTAVLGLATNNQTTSLNTTTDKQSATFTLPRNVTRAYLDVISQSQSNDEFWYTCVPNSVSVQLQNCGNTGFRETEVTIDGTPAGVAPVYPWIYTGGIDPYLWEPITGIETLNLKPYRVDLTPFAGVLSDGNPHTVAVSVYNANSSFSEASNLLLYTDPSTPVVSGGITQNTLAPEPSPSIETYIGTAADGTASGPANVQSFRAWQISGYINTAAGRVSTTLTANNSFRNLQTDAAGNTFYQQNINQEADQQEVTTTTSPAGTTQTNHSISFPLVVDYTQANNDNNDGGFFLATYIHQQKSEQLQTTVNGTSTPPVVTHETMETSDTLHYNAAGALVNHDNNTARSTFGGKDANYSCYFRSLTANNLVLTQVNDSTSCSAVQ
jgi:hypothetical protein